MKFAIARRGIQGITFDDSPEPVVNTYCTQKRKLNDSACWEHYKALLDSPPNQHSQATTQCPYGLLTTSPMGNSSAPFALTGFWMRDRGNPLLPENIINAALVTQGEFRNTSTVISRLSDGIKEDEFSHFEAAIHDARHLNQSITVNSELLLKKHGWDTDGIWDMQAIQKDEDSRRLLTIYAASRDLSLAMQMHEISRDTATAKREVAPQHVHKLFYRQVKISTDRKEQKGINIFLGASNKEVRASKAFRLIPKIILDNAIKYADRNSEIRIVFYESPSYFVVECKNRGPIVKDEDIPNLFKRGSRGSNKSGIPGQGIGLWLAKIIVDANNGSIALETRNASVDYSGRRLGETVVTIKIPN